MSTIARKSGILSSAKLHFAELGFAAASLRTIARDAGVSLTLLNYHFGNKAQLISAVAESVVDKRRKRLVAIEQVMKAGPGNYSSHDLVKCWVRADFETSTEPDGRASLRFFARMIELDGVSTVSNPTPPDDDEAMFVSGMRGCYPGTPHAEALHAFHFARAASLSFFINATGRAPSARHGSKVAKDEARLLRSIVAGVEASMTEAA